MSQTQPPAYAILQTKPVRLGDLPKIDGHNNRTIPVPNADPTVPGGVKIVRLDGELQNAFNTVTERILKAGVENYSIRRHVAFEVIATFSPEASPMPSPAELEKRGMAFMDEQWGRQNVVAAWLHLDERTPHLHALVVPICEAPAPGRPRGGGAPEPRTVVSWNRFSGSYLRDYRKEDKSGKKKRITVGPDGNEAPKTDRNETMAAWQSGWAKVWEDHGLRRGVPSSRRHLTAKWIRGKIEDINGLAHEAAEALSGVADWFVITPRDWREFQLSPRRETLSRLIAKYLQPTLEKHLEPLKEMAKRGIQLDAERQARADLADAHVKLKKDTEAVQSAHAAAVSQVGHLKTENAVLTGELEVLRPLAHRPAFDELADQSAILSDEEFARLIEARRDRRNILREATPPAAGRPKLPSPESIQQAPNEPQR
jgi:hypothetical protein